ncbi:transcription termination factor Rho, partial [Streptomyces sp. SID10244]|nr:transcription termination factor Rho [Streptomyces sp. SID10244]
TDAPASAARTSARSASGSTTRARTGLSAMVLTELRALAGELGIKGTSGMRKGDLIAAIKERQAGSAPAGKSADGQMALSDGASGDGASTNDAPKSDAPKNADPQARTRRRARVESSDNEQAEAS